MTDYIYKGFKISYTIVATPVEHDLNLYKADGSVTYLLSRPKSFVPVKFQTQLDSFGGAEHEIKKLLENYVDFELKSFYAMQKEKTR